MARPLSPASLLARQLIEASPKDRRLNIEAIAQKAGLTYSHTYRIAKSMGRNNKLTDTRMTARIKAIADGTMTAAEIAAAINANPNSVRGIIGRARRKGHVIPVAKARSIGRGSIKAAVETLDPKIQAWFHSQIPPGSNPTTLVASIITDAYFEEHPDA